MTLLQTLRRNSDLYVFLPVFYVAWSDAVLSPAEFNALRDFISRQPWINEEDKKALVEHLTPEAPPSPEEFKTWLEEVRSLGDAEPARSLTDLGLSLVRQHSGGRVGPELEQAVADLRATEAGIGYIPSEWIFLFRPEDRKTITAGRATERTFDPETLRRLLDAPDENTYQQIRNLLQRPEFTLAEPDSLSEYREKVLRWCQLLADEGLGSLGYPVGTGGKADMGAYFAVMEGLSYHDLSLVVKFGVQFGLFGMSVYFLGTDKHHKKYLPAIGALRLPGCFAMTETGHGSNVRGIETTATYDAANRTFTIHTPHPEAQKEYIGNAAVHGRMATVFAKLILNGKDYGVNAFLVPLRDEEGNTLPGVSISDCGRKMGLNGVDNGIIRFDQVVVPYDNMLDRFASVTEDGRFETPILSDNRRFFTMLGTLVGGRIGIPRSGISAAKTGLTIAIRYGDRRRQFGPEGGAEVPILNYRQHQRRLMPLLADAYAYHFALRYLTQRFLDRTEDDMQEIEALAAGLKASATWSTTRTLQECREACGGKGYMSENRIDALKNDTEIYTTFEGDNTVLMQLVAKSRLSEFKREFSNMDLLGMFSYVAEQARTTLVERNILAVRNTDESHLLDTEFHLSAFRYRERQILSSAARRIKRHLDSGMDSFDAFNVVQNHLVQVGHAYVDRIVLEQFVAAVGGVKDAPCQKILNKLCQLYALARLDEHKGWYLENGYMEGVKTKAIRKALDQLCWEVRQDAVPLTEAFGIPEVLLGPLVRPERFE